MLLRNLSRVSGVPDLECLYFLNVQVLEYVGPNEISIQA